ncbi:MAG: hypothetical protein GDA48_16515 [Hormoscilla sp. GM102CHS1]|nr:hypothetical protein [Hormoscilla sp. GM102CHS1]
MPSANSVKVLPIWASDSRQVCQQVIWALAIWQSTKMALSAAASWWGMGP